MYIYIYITIYIYIYIFICVRGLRPESAASSEVPFCQTPVGPSNTTKETNEQSNKQQHIESTPRARQTSGPGNCGNKHIQ